MRSDNLHNLIIDNIKLNDNNDDHFEDLQRRQRNIFERAENTKNSGFFEDVNNEKSLEQKNKELDKKLLHLYRLHSSKFHKQKGVKLKDDLLNMRLNLLKKSDIEKFNSKNKSVSKLRQKIAFKFRFMKNLDYKSVSPQKKRKANYKKQDDKMNKILKISKSIPDVLYKEIKTVKANEKNNINKTNNTERIRKSNEYGFNSSFKAHRYLGNLYDYYKSNIPLYIKENMMNNNFAFSTKYLPLNKENKPVNVATKTNKVINVINIKQNHSKLKSNKLKEDNSFKLSSLLS